MPKCTDGTMDLGRIGRRVIEANFEGDDIGSDRGVLLVRCVDERIGLSRAAAAVLSDPRDPARITHSLRDLLAQRIYGLCCGYEDLNDHDVLRSDLLMQTAVGRVDALASSPTLSRLESQAKRAQAVALQGQRAGARHRGHDPRAAAQDRRGHRAKHETRAGLAGLASPTNSTSIPTDDLKHQSVAAW